MLAFLAIPTFLILGGHWAAAGFDETLLRWKMETEVIDGEMKGSMIETSSPRAPPIPSHRGIRACECA